MKNSQDGSSHPVRHFYDFGPFRLDLEEKLLSYEGETLALAPKVFETLVLLIENKGRILKKDEMMKTLWPDRHVEESNLTQNIFMLRKIFSEKPGNEQYIKTIPKRGYQFTGTVKEVLEEVKQAEEESAPTE